MNEPHFYKKKLGQNFLIDKNIIKKIVSIGKINTASEVLEIGPGNGTKEIITKNPKKITAIEKDKKLVLLLNKKFENNINLNVIHEDILKFINNKKFKNFSNIIIFGNLPYNISTKILTDLILMKQWPPCYKKLILMFQKEVADRIIAKSKSSNFGRLSVISNWRLNIKKHFDVSENCFFPKPKIKSSVLSFEPIIKNKINIKNPECLEHVTRILFSNPRKMINKNIKKLFKNDNLVNSELNLNLSQRPKELDLDLIYKIILRYEKLFY